MEQSQTTKITRRIFNAILTLFTFFGLNKPTVVKAKTQTEDVNVDYMEVLIIPEEYRYPYSDKTNEVLMNHIKAGKSKYEIKKFILSRSKVIKVPLK